MHQHGQLRLVVGGQHAFEGGLGASSVGAGDPSGVPWGGPNFSDSWCGVRDDIGQRVRAPRRV